APHFNCRSSFTLVLRQNGALTDSTFNCQEIASAQHSNKAVFTDYVW
uniref:Uncharacterized protein n=1 Tax=Pristionchus pacificus TaxID=54126 RepID=A0A2A6BIV1_PRIPA